MLVINQALICYMAALTLCERTGLKITDTAVHAIANNMDDCFGCNTHKYIRNEPIEVFMECQEGRGVVAFWTFKDGSKLVYCCNGFCLIDKRTDDQIGNHGRYIDLRTLGDREPVHQEN